LVYRLVLDSNIYISALLWNGNERKRVSSCQEGRYNSIISFHILNEIERVLVKKFNLTTEVVNEYLSEILTFSDLVVPTMGINEITDDPSDNRILETAVEGMADYIISGDQHLLNLKQYRDILIIRTSEILF